MIILILWLLLVLVFFGSAFHLSGKAEEQSCEIEKLLEQQKTDGLGHF